MKTYAKIENLKNAHNAGFLTDAKYFFWGLPGAMREIFLRAPVLKKLQEAEKSLPKDIRFLLFDGFRSYETQQFLYDDLFARLRIQHPQWTMKEIQKEIQGYVSLPQKTGKVSPHLTGYAIDLTLVRTEKNHFFALEMGTDFDDFSERSWTHYFEKNPPQTLAEEQAHNNRSLLFETLTAHGFQNLPKEWWHFECFFSE